MTPDELRRLARDRPLVTLERHEPNAYYGHDAVLKRYLGRPGWRPLPAAVEHSVYVSGYIWDVEADTPLRTILCSTPERAARYVERDPDAAAPVPIGPVTAYMPPPPPPPASGGALLAFPAHSTHLLESQFDVDEFIGQLESVRQGFDTVRVCLYWKDVLLGRDAPYRAAGYTCVTAGHIYDAGFLFRLRDIFAGARGVVANEVGSPVLYSVLWDRPVWVTEQKVRREAASAEIIAREQVSDQQWEGETATLRALFAEPSWELTDEQRDHLRWFTGIPSVRPPSALRQILAEAAARYRAAVPPAERRQATVALARRAARAARQHPAGVRGILRRGR
ncbi:MAG TPA: hypothetical protein VNZ62_13365 [Capillimicrobium sp.]|nr:hypothetical protein [Capillimicrobium sp.]